MNRGLFLKIMICIFVFSLSLFSYVDKKNGLTTYKIEVPKLAREINTLKQQIKKLQYEVDQFENPTNLMQLAQRPEFNHLRHPLVDEVLTLKEGLALKENDSYMAIGNAE
ncbi:MAG: hypothetical protein HZB76_01700 [Chlamydiae bacterium]|nr:hypothetical protein [Chlamydiota bacterium]